MLYSLIADLKDLLEVTLHLSRDALHVHIGLAIFVACAAVVRGRRRLVLAFILLLGVCLFSEAVDLAMAVHNGGMPNWLGGAKDVINTMFWPGVWLLAGPSIQRLLRLGQAREVHRRPAGPVAAGIAQDAIQHPIR